MASTRPASPKYVPPSPAVMEADRGSEHVCLITGAEASEDQAFVPGEDPEERLDAVDNNPVRILNHFAIFDPSRAFEFVSLTQLDGSEKSDFQAVGYVSPAFVNEEDADQDDDVDDDRPDPQLRWRTTKILSYSIDYTQNNE